MLDNNILKNYPLANFTFNYIRKNDLFFSKTLSYIFDNFDETYISFCEELLTVLKNKCNTEDKFLKSIKGFLKFSREFLFLQVKLHEEGKYINSSFDEVNKTVYQSERMDEYYLDGLFLSQILWPNHYKIGRFFINQRNLIKENCSILDVGCGAGIYSYYLGKMFTYEELEIIDISPYSIAYTKKILECSVGDLTKLHTTVTDIYTHNFDNNKFDFVICGELLEHVNYPIKLLEKLIGVLANEGKIFLTTAIYAAEIDHIYLFDNISEVRELLNKKFRIISEMILPTSFEEFREDMNKVPINYACVLIK